MKHAHREAIMPRQYGGIVKSRQYQTILIVYYGLISCSQ